jgi:hypothetical protein
MDLSTDCLREFARSWSFFYANLRRFEDAKLHFQQAAAKVALNQASDPQSRDKCLEEIRNWESEVEKMEMNACAEEIKAIPVTADSNPSGMFRLDILSDQLWLILD